MCVCVCIVTCAYVCPVIGYLYHAHCTLYIVVHVHSLNMLHISIPLLHPHSPHMSCPSYTPPHPHHITPIHTGTPLQNDLMELWSLMHFLMPQVFASHDQFKNWFSNPLTGMVEGQQAVNKDIVGRLHSVLRPFLLRRLKADVEKQLPQKHEHVIMCRLSRRQRTLYEDYMASSDVQATMASGNFLGMINCLMQLRKVCGCFLGVFFVCMVCVWCVGGVWVVCGWCVGGVGVVCGWCGGGVGGVCRWCVCIYIPHIFTPLSFPTPPCLFNTPASCPPLLVQHTPFLSPFLTGVQSP